MINKSIFKNLKDKKVLITGHTGFKGAYLCIFLHHMGAEVYGYALKEEKGSLYEVASVRSLLKDEVIDDIRDYDKLKSFVGKVDPDYIIHMAAQPLVLKGYDEPRYTYEVNVMGTANLFEAIRVSKLSHLKSVINVTTDKVYENLERPDYAFVENDKLCGYDPYSNSKSCSELVTYSYKHAFFSDNDIAITTCRAGNVIGGGDVCENRIIPDLYRGIKDGKKTIMRNPDSIRPYQYVLEPIIMYTYIMLKTAEDKSLAGNYNIGPDKKDCLTTKDLSKAFFDAWGLSFDEHVDIKVDKNAPHESSFLRLDNKKVKDVFSYEPLVSMTDCMRYTTEVYKAIL
ncbi:MAG: CDP-glucose 4,6-dehydratase [Lachnospiraceae bacterium]|nr:CDP-glucose 4,6-dehydratase [Lachnospiraceae bacterium]